VTAGDGRGLRMSNRKLNNIHPSGAFSPEVTSPDVTIQRDLLLPLFSSSSSATATLLLLHRRRIGSNSVEIPSQTGYKQKQNEKNETHYENITH
jgi:hypothetical protein